MLRRLVVLLLVLPLWRAAAATPLPADGRFYLILEGAVGRQPLAEPVPLTLVLERQGGAWQPFFVSRIYRLDCPSVLRAVAEADGETRLQATVLLTPCWRMGIERQGYTRLAEYEVRVALGPDGTPAGRWSGRLDGAECAGLVKGLTHALRAGPCPPAPALGEHPRFLIRKEDLPALRAKAQTPWGQALLKRLDVEDWSRSSRAVALGLLYQLNGDREFAGRARTLVEQDLDSGWWLPIGPIHDPAHKAAEAVLAYDLIYETCPPEFHTKMRRACREYLASLYDYGHISAGNDHDFSNWNAQYRAAVGMLALALAADPGEAPAPAPPAEAPHILPPANLPPDGAPVWRLDEPLPLADWLFAGPLNIGLGHDGLAALGGASAARAVNGAKFAVKVKAQLPPPGPDAAAFSRIANNTATGDDLQPLTQETTACFAPLGTRFLIGAQTRTAKPEDFGKLDLWEAAGRRHYQTMYLYSVLEVPAETFVRVRPYWHQVADSCVYLSGTRVPGGECVRLAPGRHSVLVPLTMTTAVNAHGRASQWFSLALTPQAPEAAAKEEAHLRAVAAYETACREVYARLAAAGPVADLEGLRWRCIGRYRLANFSENALGDRGWNTAGEGYTQHCLRLAHVFAHAYRRGTGTDVSDRPNLGWVLPQAVCRTVFGPEGAVMHSYGPGAGPLGVDNYARGFGCVPSEFRPAVLWAWRRTQELADAGKFKSRDLLVDHLDCLSAACAFVNWPGQETERDPDEILPRAVADRQRGGYTFRNRWQDADDCVALFTLNRSPGGDWGDNCAGEFRFQGLGAEWAVRGMGSGCAPNLPVDRTRLCPPAPGGAPVGSELAYAASPDGSGTVSATLDGWLSNGRKVRAWRSFAVDYSGRAGVPALLAVADRLTPEDSGAPLPNCQWQFVTLPDHEVKRDAAGFTISSAAGAVLRATFVQPAKLSAEAVTIEPKQLKHENNYHGDHWNGFHPRKVITVRGDGAFFVVFTLSRGAAPEPSVTGSGLDAAASVGRLKVRFDGRTLVLSDQTGEEKK